MSIIKQKTSSDLKKIRKSETPFTNKKKLDEESEKENMAPTACKSKTTLRVEDKENINPKNFEEILKITGRKPFGVLKPESPVVIKEKKKVFNCKVKSKKKKNKTKKINTKKAEMEKLLDIKKFLLKSKSDCRKMIKNIASGNSMKDKVKNAQREIQRKSIE